MFNKKNISRRQGRNNISFKNILQRNKGNSFNYAQNYCRSFTTIQEGASGSEVERLQEKLLERVNDYSSLPIVIVDGMFGSLTKTAVEKFQDLNSLAPTGVVDRITWEKLCKTREDKNISSSIRDKSGAGSLDQSKNVISEGSVNNYVRDLQNYLNSISKEYISIPKLKLDGIFGKKTKGSVLEFQRLFSLTTDGTVGDLTWNAIYNEYMKVK